MKRVAVVGHANIEKWFHNVPPNNGEEYNIQIYNIIFKDLLLFGKQLVSEDLNVEFVSGMARGIDEIWADVAIKLNVPLSLIIPGSIKWHSSRPYSRGIRAQAIKYAKICSYMKINRIMEVPKHYNQGHYKYVNFARNQALVDYSTDVYSYLMGPSVGTEDCINRAIKAKKYRKNLYKKLMGF